MTGIYYESYQVTKKTQHRYERWANTQNPIGNSEVAKIGKIGNATYGRSGGELDTARCGETF
jgi:hypothetical protein